MIEIRKERGIMLGVWVAAAVGCLLGTVDPPAFASHAALGRQVVDLLRIAVTVALVITLLLGPGILLRKLSGRAIGLGFVPLPGLALLVVTAIVAWVLAPGIAARWTCLAILSPVLLLMYVALLVSGPDDMLSSEEQRVLILTSLGLGLAVARSLWSLGPALEYYVGTVSRTLVPEARPDSAISYLIPELVAHGARPYSNASNALFSPYNFSSRGPLPGLASTPIVLLSGARLQMAHPPLAPWQPFDALGFMAYRIAMITFSSTALLSLWELVRTIGRPGVARFAVLLGVTTPFYISDLWYTWPKMLGASSVLLAAAWLVRRRPFRAGIAVGLGYLMHPSALFGLVALGPVSLWPIKAARWRHPKILNAVLLLVGTGILVGAWRIYNGPHFLQNTFIDYLKVAYPYTHPTVAQWGHFRLISLGDTIVPLFLPIFEAHSIAINVALSPRNPWIVHFFFQYQTGVPFGFGIVFFPLLLVGLWRAIRRWPWPVFATVVLPFLAFLIYWGDSISGMLREGLQAWVLAVVAVLALEQGASGFPWARSRPVRVVLCVRAIEVLGVAIVTTLATDHLRLVSSHYKLTDAVALCGVVGFAGLMVRAVWDETGLLSGPARVPKVTRPGPVEAGVAV
jgi:hypothetical protein